MATRRKSSEKVPAEGSEDTRPIAGPERAPIQTPLVARRMNIRGTARVMVYCMFACTVMATLALRSAWGDLKESATVIGRQLAQFEDLVGSSHRVRINGEPMYVASALTDQGVEQVLDRFETACKEHAGGLAEAFSQLPETLRAGAELEGSAGLGILREQGDGEGWIACLSQDNADGLAGLSGRVEQAVTTGDLSKLGDLRYIYAKTTKARRTHVVSVWTEGPFRIANTVALDGGEPPGSDSANAPRPLDAVRLLSAEIEGAPYAVRIYDSSASGQELLRQYDEQMPAMGWQSLELVAQEVPYARAFNREGVDMLVFTYPEQGRTYVSVVEMRPR